MIEISQTVPFPEQKKTGKGIKKYPFREMQVGDSFLISDPDLAASVAVQASKHSKMGKRFKCHTTENGIRVHRVS